ncbi:MAG TPA: ABC transporter ATP-binding protein [Desulfobaccales bacterium]|nr:ABC transporter ATP-binding protein [Desulfobaccales bacterium]
MSHHLIEMEDVHYAYPDGNQVLKGVSFRITHGENVALVGANGAGKSTLLLQLNGCLLPQAGRVVIGELPVTKKTLKHVRRTVGLVFQDPDDQLFMPLVFDDVAFGPLNLGLGPEEVEGQVMKALAAVGAVHLKDRPPYRLSDGEKRAVAIAAVLSLNPAILVMDEPSSNLDPKTRRQLIELLRTFEHTLIIATHDLDLVLDLCPRTLVLKEGRIAGDGPTLSIMEDEELLASCNLEKPLRMQGCPRCSLIEAESMGVRA